MALNVIACRMIAPYLRGRILCLGVPIVLLTDEECEAIFGVKPRKKVSAPWWSDAKETPDPYDICEQLGVELVCVDAIAHDGREVVANLNEPHDLGEFDLVVDAGTTEHCFNVAQAIVNASNAVKVGGRILHTNPVSMGNHAFYNFCPTLMVDFYRANGFELEFLEIRDRMGEGERVPFSTTERFKVGNNWAMYCMARRVERKPLVMPIQSKYAHA
jgi:hypothetical protein